MNITSRILITCLGCSLSSSAVSAAISMVIDTNLQTLIFSGSDTGLSYKPPEGGGFEVADWDFRIPSGNVETINVGPAFSETFSSQTDLYIYDGGTGAMLLVFSNTNQPFSSLTTKSRAAIDYSGIALPSIALLEGFGSGTLAISNGTGFSDISFTTVPEAGTFSIMASAVSLIVLVRRRRPS